MKIVIIRHADPDYENNTLTAKGFDEIKALGKFYNSKDFTNIYCSPLNRAILTCEAIAKSKENYKILPWLTEFFHPIYIEKDKGRINWDLDLDFIEKNKDQIFDDKQYLNIEAYKKGNIKMYYDEVVQEFDKLLAEHGYVREGSYYRVAKPNNDVLCFVCHLGIGSVLMSRLFNLPYTSTSQYFGPSPCSVTTIISEERVKGKAQFRCASFGSTTHLYIDGQKESSAGRFPEVFDLSKNDERRN